MTAPICPECGSFMNRQMVCQGCGANWFEDHSEGPDFDGEIDPEEYNRINELAMIEQLDAAENEDHDPDDDFDGRLWGESHP
jgi:hypothetical protein